MVFKNRYKTIFVLLFFFLVISLVYAANLPTSQGSSNCSEYIITISKLNQSISNLTTQLDYYKNLSEYYKELYENKNANLTNREVIEINNNLNIIHQNISNLFQRVENIENNIESKLTIFSWEYSLSIGVGVAGGVTLIEIVLYFKRKKKQHDKK